MKKICAFLTVSLLTASALVAEELSGKLLVPEGAGTKESYRSGNFQLWGRKGRAILTESSKISAQQLIRFRDQWVTIEAEFLPSQAADPQEQAPMSMDPDGKATLEDHPASFRVLSIRPYTGPKFPLR